MLVVSCNISLMIHLLSKTPFESLNFYNARGSEKLNPLFLSAILGKILDKRKCLKCKRPQVFSSAKMRLTPIFGPLAKVESAS